MMTDRLSNTELKRVNFKNNKFVSLLLRLITTLKLTSFLQASLLVYMVHDL